MRQLSSQGVVTSRKMISSQAVSNSGKSAVDLRTVLSNRNSVAAKAYAVMRTVTHLHA